MDVEKDLLEHIGCGGPSNLYEKYRISSPALGGKIIVSLQDNWLDGNCKECHPHFDSYEDLQSAVGEGLEFIDKEYVSVIKRTFFVFSRVNHDEFTLAIPTAAEDFSFDMEIFESRASPLHLLWAGYFSKWDEDKWKD